jgi:hypothetical protein
LVNFRTGAYPSLFVAHGLRHAENKLQCVLNKRQSLVSSGLQVIGKTQGISSDNGATECGSHVNIARNRSRWTGRTSDKYSSDDRTTLEWCNESKHAAPFAHQSAWRTALGKLNILASSDAYRCDGE